MGAPWQAMSALVDRVRRALYEHVRRQPRPVTRDAAAEALGISRGLAAFHLDKLVNAGLLDAAYQTPELRRGPGRTPKVYTRSDLQLSLTIPERRYELVGEILSEAVTTEPGNAWNAAHRIAFRRGSELGAAARSSPVPWPPIAPLLADLGFEPGPPGEVIELRNCPFHRLAAHQPALVCGLNHAFLRGLLSGLGQPVYRAVLAPGEHRCCVVLRARAERTAALTAADRDQGDVVLAAVAVQLAQQPVAEQLEVVVDRVGDLEEQSHPGVEAAVPPLDQAVGDEQ